MQDSIRSRRLSRAASLAGSGTRVGVNYLKHYGKKALTGNSDESALHEANATEVYGTFAKLKGGPLKLAQMLSIDKNMLPEAYRSQFAQAQYSAPPLSYPLVSRTFRREFGKEPTELFDTFTKEAVCGASIGQVHRATKDGKEYAVKVQYPGVAESLTSDLALVKPFALQILGLRDADVAPYFAEVQERLLEETDYKTELANSQKLSESSGKIPGVRFPTYYPELSSSKVLTMSWEPGVPLDKFTAAHSGAEHQELRDRIGQALWDFYHHEIHELRIFHADPHPGNFLVDDEGVLTVLDFGCTKAVGDPFYSDYFKLLSPGFLNDREAFAEALVKLDILQPDDPARARELIIENAHRGTSLLARPFHESPFDFGDPKYMEAIVELGESGRKDRDLKEIKTARGSADAIYLNRAYFGLYSLMAALRARVKTVLPEPAAA